VTLTRIVRERCMSASISHWGNNSKRNHAKN